MHGLTRAEAHRAYRKALALAAWLALPGLLWTWRVAGAGITGMTAVVVPLVALAIAAGTLGSAAFGDDIWRGTVVFTLTRPVSRYAIWRVKLLIWMRAATVVTVPLAVVPYLALLHAALSGSQEAAVTLDRTLAADVLLLGPAIWLAVYLLGAWLGAVARPGAEVRPAPHGHWVVLGLALLGCAWWGGYAAELAGVFPWVVLGFLVAAVSAWAGRNAYLSLPVLEFDRRDESSTMLALLIAVGLALPAYLAFLVLFGGS